MSFPVRILRSIFGPTFQDTRPVEHPETEFGADKMELLLWQLGGMNQTAARATLAAAWVTSAFQVFHQGQAWNPKGAQANPVLARTSAGVYTWTFAATYPDLDGVQVSPNIGAVRITCHKILANFGDRIEAHAWRDASNAGLVHIRLWSTAGAPVDEPFWIEAL